MTDEQGDAPELPVRRLTYALSERFEDAESADRWLSGAKADADQPIARTLAVINRAIDAYRAAAGDPAIHEPGNDDLLTVRLGYGTGDEIAASRWSEAVKLPPERRAKRRRPGTEDIRPQQRLAAILSGKETVDAWELHAVRAQSDLDGGRPAAAAAELRAALAAFDESPPDFAENLREEIAGRLAAARTALAARVIEDEALRDAVDVLTRLQNRRRRPRADY